MAEDIPKATVKKQKELEQDLKPVTPSETNDNYITIPKKQYEELLLQNQFLKNASEVSLASLLNQLG